MDSTHHFFNTVSVILLLLFVSKIHQVCLFLPEILISKSGDCHPNPGPNYLFPCGICEKPCKSNQNCIACDSCDQWFHVKCMEMPLSVFHANKNTSWICCTCGLPNFSTTLFETTHNDTLASSIVTENSYSILSSSSDGSITSPASSTRTQSVTSTDCSIGSPQHTSSPIAKNPKKHRQSSFRILVINFQSIRAKRTAFWLLLKESDPDIIIGCETWLHPGIYEREVLPEGYHFVARRDRTYSQHGGVMIATRDNIIATEIPITTSTELCAASFQTKNQHSLIVTSAYRPPNSDSAYTEELCLRIKELQQNNPNSTLWITGDMNLPDIDWENCTIPGNRNPTHINQLFLNLLYDTGTEQIVNFPTRSNNTLDLFATNRPSLIEKCKPVPGVSDHDIVFIQTSTHVPKQKPPRRKILLWKQTDSGAMKTDTKNQVARFTQLHSRETNINTLWTTFRDLCTSIIGKHVPNKTSSTRYSQPWINRQVKRMSRRKKRAHRRALQSGKQEDWEHYKKIQKDAQYECRKAHNTYVKDLVSEDRDPKKLYTFIKGKRCDSSGVSSLKNQGIAHSDPKVKASLLNQQFCSVFNTEDTSTIPSLPGKPYPHIHPFDIGTKGVLKLLQALDPHKAAGPDLIPTRFLKEVADEICPALTLVFQASLYQGKVPEDWKQALVTPIFKKGDRSSPANYRPISLTSVCCKMLEHIIHSQVMAHLDLHDILNDAQHGFRKRRSCESQLTVTLQDLAEGLDAGEQIDAILLDFSKAFDKVPHERLLVKLQHYGIHDNVLHWIRSFLSNRSQQVLVEGHTSNQAPVTSGVPQGTVLGPLLFLLYINDLPSRVTSTSRLFADDSLLYRKIRTQTDSAALQEDLENLQQWEKDWMMSFNPSKCEVIRISRKRSPTQGHYTIHGHRLNIAKTGRYLGVTLSDDLSWKPHVDATTRKANNSLAFLRRNLSSCPRETKNLAYRSLVRPTLEYAAPVWDPHTQNCIQQLEMVQRRAARFVMGDYKTTSSTSQMVSQLGWLPLQQRRQQAKLTLMYRIVYGLVDIHAPHYLHASTASTRGHAQRYIVPFCRTDYLRHSFFPSATRLWNAIPDYLATAATLEAFKDGLVLYN